HPAEVTGVVHPRNVDVLAGDSGHLLSFLRCGLFSMMIDYTILHGARKPPGGDFPGGIFHDKKRQTVYNRKRKRRVCGIVFSRGQPDALRFPCMESFGSTISAPQNREKDNGISKRNRQQKPEKEREICLKSMIIWNFANCSEAVISSQTRALF
ncbi:MAG: hypothetical protein J6P58_05945, partial [Oscillospiraceae bacterium]|nr:hypothetical protein [Oscillospiraceae bacterium]